MLLNQLSNIAIVINKITVAVLIKTILISLNEGSESKTNPSLK